MGMPGSETALEELMYRVLGDLLMENRVAKLADDLYCGGDTLTELADNWSQLLMALDKSSLRLPLPRLSSAQGPLPSLDGFGNKVP